jgi:hypothetical protein
VAQPELYNFSLIPQKELSPNAGKSPEPLDTQARNQLPLPMDEGLDVRRADGNSWASKAARTDIPR